MKLIGTLATPEDQFQRIDVEAGDYPAARAGLFSQVPEGSKLVSIRVERG